MIGCCGSTEWLLDFCVNNSWCSLCNCQQKQSRRLLGGTPCFRFRVQKRVVAYGSNDQILHFFLKPTSNHEILGGGCLFIESIPRIYPPTQKQWKVKVYKDPQLKTCNHPGADCDWIGCRFKAYLFFGHYHASPQKKHALKEWPSQLIGKALAVAKKNTTRAFRGINKLTVGLSQGIS